MSDYGVVLVNGNIQGAAAQSTTPTGLVALATLMIAGLPAGTRISSATLIAGNGFTLEIEYAPTADVAGGLDPTTLSLQAFGAATASEYIAQRNAILAPFFAGLPGQYAVDLLQAGDGRTEMMGLVIVSTSSGSGGAFPGFGGAPPDTNITGGVAGVSPLASRSDHTHKDGSIATWTGIRYYAVDYDNGNDNNAGFSDVSMAAAGAVAVKHIETVLAKIPRVGAGRALELAIARRAGGIPYRNITNTADADLSTTDLVGYRIILVRGTGTDPTAAAVAFAGDAADRVYLGARIVSGTNGPGYNPTGVPTTSVIDCVLAGGGAPGLPAEPGVIGKRIRFDAATTTVALRNVCRMIYQNTASVITVSNNLPAVPVGTDVFYIEEPGTAINTITTGSPVQGADPLAPVAGLSLAGLRSDKNTGATPSLVAAGILGRFQLSFVDLAETYAFDVVQIAGCLGSVVFTTFYPAPDVTFPAPGPSLRVVGSAAGLGSGVLVSECQDFGRFEVAAITLGRLSVRRSSFTTVLTGCYTGAGASFLQNPSVGNSSTATGSSIGNRSSSNQRRWRNVGNTATAQAALDVNASPCNIRGCDITGAGAQAVINLQGNQIGWSINDVIGSTGNTGPGLRLIDARNCSILMGQFVANTFTGAANQDIVGNSAFFSHANYAISRLSDGFTNEITGGGNGVGICLGTLAAFNDSGGALGQYLLIRSSGGSPAALLSGMRLAQADTAGNAAGLLGATHALTVANGATTMLSVGPAVWAQFDGAPTIGAIAYLSPTVAGNATTTVPALAATNQKLRLGRVASVSGTLGRIIWAPEALSVLADGLP